MTSIDTKSVEALELFPELLPDTSTMYKKWIWREETNTLEQISTGMQISTDPRIYNWNRVKKINRTVLGTVAPLVNSPLTLKKKRISPQPPTLLTMSPKSSTSQTAEQRTVTLNHVKGVAFDMLTENGNITEGFHTSLRLKHFDGLLIVILHYFDLFFQKIEMENKARPMAIEPSTVELKRYQQTMKKLEMIKRQLAEKYCSLILGLECEKQHHMACGRQRKSYTKKDKMFYEEKGTSQDVGFKNQTLYTYCSYVVWICFRRDHFKLIQEELGSIIVFFFATLQTLWRFRKKKVLFKTVTSKFRLFRSPAFNPFGRHGDKDEFKLASNLTSADIHDIKLTPPSLKKNKRPPIKSIINQRSPVLVSVFPNSKESSAWLLDRRKAYTQPVIVPDDDEILPPTVTNSLNIGIIGELLSGFNPFTLAPFGEDEREKERKKKTDANKIKTPNTENEVERQKSIALTAGKSWMGKRTPSHRVLTDEQNTETSNPESPNPE